MPINPDAVGQESEPGLHVLDVEGRAPLRRRHRCRHRRAGLHDREHRRRRPAGVPHVRRRPRLGAGRAPCGASARFNPAMLVHGEQRGHAAQADPVGGLGDADSPSSSASTTRARPPSSPPRRRPPTTATASRCTRTYSSAFIRGEGGWGGDRGPSGPRNVPPERAPDHAVTYQTSPDQALVYRLSGDRNPLHSDPAFAAMGGFDRPILHGLCTYGFTGRALLHTLCGSDPARFQHVEGRFSSPVLPGDALTISMWDDRRRRGRLHDVASRTARSSSTRAPCASPPDRQPHRLGHCPPALSPAK